MDNPEKLATRRGKTNQKHNTICVSHHYTQTNTNNVNKTWVLLQTAGGEDDTKGVIRIRISKKNKQHNDQKKKDKQRSTKHTHQTKDRVIRTPLKTVGELRCSGSVSNMSLLITCE
jgi:hypothetical protein